MIDTELSDGICILRLNAPPLNPVTLELLEALREACALAGRDDAVTGIVITGGREHFSAGADVNLFRRMTSAADAAPISDRFQAAFAEIEGSAKPVAAAVAGRVMGGALELAMACHYRIACRGTSFSMPEVLFAFCPGAGGTQRLPRLVGPEKALQMLLTAEAVGADEALALGLVDAVCEPDGLVETAADILRSSATPRRTCQLREKVCDADANVAALEAAKALAQKSRPEIVAPWKIIEAVKAGLHGSFQAGSKRECRAFAECVDTPATRNKIYQFFAVREMTRTPELADARPKPVRNAAVVGMGSMGTGIVQALISAGLPTVVCDQAQRALDRGVEKIRRSLARRVEQGRMTTEKLEGTLALVTATTDRARLAGADLVIESVFEDVAVKREVIGELDRRCSPDAVIATNTSTISLDVLAEGMSRPARLVGMHFFNPAHRMPLVEVIRRESTSAEAVATVMETARRLRKSPVLVNNRVGFLVNRIFIPYLKEAFQLLEEGAEPEAIDAAMVDFGFAMGPLVLTDMAGVDILVDTDRVLAEAFPRHGPISPIATRLVDAGRLGQKTGSGVYRYEPGDRAPHESEFAQKIIAQVRKERPVGIVAPSSGGENRLKPGLRTAEITERLVLRMVSEAFRVLEEGVARSDGDVDAAMVLGTGFPDFRGGVVKYGLDLGLDTLRGRLDNLAETVGERYSPCRLLREMKGAC